MGRPLAAGFAGAADLDRLRRENRDPLRPSPVVRRSAGSTRWLRRLTMRPTPGSSWSVSGTESDGEAPEIDVDGSSVSIDAGDRGSFFGRTGRTDWTVGVPTDAQVALGMTVNAGENAIELSGANLGSVR